jgi:hypothetical protein
MRYSSAALKSRREFLRAAARYSLLSGLAAAGVMAVRRRQGERCVNAGVCRGCQAFTGCGLPQALSAKNALPS